MFKTLASPRRCRSLATALVVLLFSLLGWARSAHATSSSIVISQVYGGGGNTGALYRNDFIELFNRGAVPVDVTGWSVQYASTSGTSWAFTTLSGVIQPGRYYLVQEAIGAGGSVSLPTPDAIGTLAMSGTAGKVALVAGSGALSGSCPAGVVDLVGYGTANCFESSSTAVLSNTTAAIRQAGGCSETDNNASDFAVSAPSPRNSAAAANSCGEVAPAVTTTSPASGATNVSIAASVSVNFSEPVNVVAGAISVECPPGAVVASNSSPLTGVTTATLVPPTGLPFGTACQILVSASGISDADLADPPDGLAGDFSAGFTTVAAAACGAPDTPIGQIQGSGLTAALFGSQTVQGVVVGDFEFPGSGATGDYLRGFFMQNVAGADDGNDETSDAIFVFNGSNDSVSLGQLVQVTGTVSEFGFFSAGGSLTELTPSNLEICGTSGTISAVSVALPQPSPTALERYEGMLVSFQQPLYVTEHFQLGRFGQVTLSGAARLPQPTNIALPGAPALAQQAANDSNQILLDDDTQVQNPDPIKFGRNGSPLSASNTLRGGDWVLGLTGVLTETDATTASNVTAATDPVRYRVRPVGSLNGAVPNFQSANARPGVPPEVAGSLKVAGFNLLNYFNTFGTTSCTYGLGGAVAECRGADNASEFARQAQKTVAAALGTGADVLVVSELENDGYGATSAIADLTNKLNAAAPGVWAFIDVDARTGQTNALGVDAIKVAMLYKPARVTPIGQTAVANTGAFGLYTVSGGSPIQRSRPALAQAFRETTGARGQVVIVGNHLKSKGSGCEDNLSPVGPDPDVGDGQGNCNLTRKAAATQLANWLAGNPTATGEARVLILGDMNAYAKEDPIAALQSAGYTDLIASKLGPAGYSYVFGGQWGYLDHALGSPSLLDQVVDVAEWHINADEPNVLDYNTDFKSTGQISSLYAADVYRASDHDPVIVGLNLLAPAPTSPMPAPAGNASYAAALLLALGTLGVLSQRRRPRAHL